MYNLIIYLSEISVNQNERAIKKLQMRYFVLQTKQLPAQFETQTSKDKMT